MFDFHEKRKIRNFLYSKGIIFIIFLGSVLLLVSVYNRYVVANEMKDKLEARTAELESLKQRANLLESKVEYMGNERGIEEELRNRFDVAKEGEQVIILIDGKGVYGKQTEDGSDNVPSVAPTVQEKPFLDFLRFW